MTNHYAREEAEYYKDEDCAPEACEECGRSIGPCKPGCGEGPVPEPEEPSPLSRQRDLDAICDLAQAKLLWEAWQGEQAVQAEREASSAR